MTLSILHGTQRHFLPTHHPTRKGTEWNSLKWVQFPTYSTTRNPLCKPLVYLSRFTGTVERCPTSGSRRPLLLLKIRTTNEKSWTGCVEEGTLFSKSEPSFVLTFVWRPKRIQGHFVGDETQSLTFSLLCPSVRDSVFLDFFPGFYKKKVSLFVIVLLPLLCFIFLSLSSPSF